jgi:hypothetical protein
MTPLLQTSGDVNKTGWPHTVSPYFGEIVWLLDLDRRTQLSGSPAHLSAIDQELSEQDTNREFVRKL